MAGYLGGLVATWTYLPGDGPMYPIGNGLNLAVSAGITIVAGTGLLWMKHDNKRRDALAPEKRRQKLEGLTGADIAELEWKHPDFRWKP